MKEDSRRQTADGRRQVTVAVCLPSVGRAEQLERRAGELLLQQTPAGAQLLVSFAVVEDDEATMSVVQQLMAIYGKRTALFAREHNTTAVVGWNCAYQAARWQGADWFVLGADDVVWRVGWLESALNVAAKTGAQVIGLNDGGHTDLSLYAPHYMASRWFCEDVLGGHLAPPEYGAWWFDREVCERAQALGLYAPAWDAWAEHLHPDWYKAAVDETYLMGRAFHDVDRVLYVNRKRRGFAQDAQKLATLKEVV